MVEVDKLLVANFIREVYHPEWLANIVIVKKANGKWRTCIDFTNLNGAYPKDSFPLPRIDQLVDSRQDTSSSSSWMLSPGTTKYKWPKNIKRRLLSLPARGSIVIELCPSI